VFRERGPLQRSIKNDRGLIIIAANDQNWNEYMLHKFIGAFRIIFGKDARGVLGMDLSDQYTPSWLTIVKKEELGDLMIICAGVIRDTEKAHQVIELAKKYPVLAFMHVENGLQAVLDRFSDMGCTGFEDHIAAIIRKEPLLRLYS